MQVWASACHAGCTQRASDFLYENCSCIEEVAIKYNLPRFNLEKWIRDDEILKAVKNATKDNMGPVSSALSMQCPRSDKCSINMIIFIVSTIFMFVLAIVSVVGGS